MAWCPKCRAEYRPHIARCADCDSKLVAELEPEPVPAVGQGDEFEQVLLCSVRGDVHVSLVVNALAAAGISSRVQAGNAGDIGYTGALRHYVTGIFVNRRDEARAREIYRVYEGQMD